jgi:hypothetical protein
VLTKAITATAHKASVCVLLAGSHYCTQTATLCTAHVAGVRPEKEIGTWILMNFFLDTARLRVLVEYYKKLVVFNGFQQQSI